MSDTYFAGFDSQVNDSWIVVLDSLGETSLILKLPLIKVAKYGNNVINICTVMDALRKFPKINMLAEEIKSFGQGSKGTFTFGSALNLIGQLQVEPTISLALALPKDWKGAWGLSSNKHLSVVMAKDMGLVFPDSAYSRKKDGSVEPSHNLAESYLLAQFVYQASIKKR